MDARYEIKHNINTSDYAQLRARLRTVAKPDEHADENGEYKVRSLYFDNYTDKAVVEKLSGQSRREKFRLRYYNDDITYILLERKGKDNRKCYKESIAVTAELAAAALTGDYGGLKNPGEPLLMELYSKIRSQNLRPRNIVDYSREAYTFRAGNVRVTFDSNIRMSNNVAAFLDPGLTTIPAANTIILEIKYSGFLPDIIRDILQIGWRNQTEFSKYVAARLV